LSGAIAYYKNAKQAFDRNPRDMNSVDDLKGFKDRIHNLLAQYQHFSHEG